MPTGLKVAAQIMIMIMLCYSLERKLSW